ncbi:DUF2637 domain-containing protein [Streptomyces sp. YIM 98790]|uniref:DUF2637 domain-containing protein n=1 Tax=Streptomyces sp. YIM 98790 TaxID=2689077 RepID=UPI0014078C99|nr:DUF2637 domain-containing protein [Streptomyces sp. YIM 98790]
MRQPSPTTIAPVGAWDRIAIIALGTAGCALSYDALQQMAVAIHVRGMLTYLFPLVIDGFIAYGVRALLVMATAPLRARLYVWTLFAGATAASIWANALHAIRLNQQTVTTGLRLGDSVVAILSTLAPLALAGAVHLYILITRHHPTGSSHRPDHHGPDRSAANGSDSPQPEQLVPMGTPPWWAVSQQPPDAAAGDRSATAAAPSWPADRSGARLLTPAGPGTRTGPAAAVTYADRPEPSGRSGPAPAADRGTPARANRSATAVRETRSAVPGADRESAPADGPVRRTVIPGAGPDRDRASSPDGPPADRSAQTLEPTSAPDADRTGAEPADRAGVPGAERSAALGADRARSGTGTAPPGADRSASEDESEEETLQRLLPLVREVAEREGRLTRVLLRQVLRSHDIRLGNDRIGPLLQRLRTEIPL